MLGASHRRTHRTNGLRRQVRPGWPPQRSPRFPSKRARGAHCLSYSPLLTRFSTVNPAFLASEIDKVLGELKVDQTRRTGFLQAGHWVKGEADSGRTRVNLPPQTLQSPSQSSYSYNGIILTYQGLTFLPNHLRSSNSRSVGTRAGRVSARSDPYSTLQPCHSRKA